jgi:hypothetical protein
MDINLKLEARALILRAIYGHPALRAGEWVHPVEGDMEGPIRADAARLACTRALGESAGAGQNTLNHACAHVLRDLYEKMQFKSWREATVLFALASEVWAHARTQRPWRPPEAYAEAKKQWLDCCSQAWVYGGVRGGGALALAAGRGHWMSRGCCIICRHVEGAHDLEVRLRRNAGRATWEVALTRPDGREVCPIPNEDGSETVWFPERLRLGFLSDRGGWVEAYLQEDGHILLKAIPRHKNDNTRSWVSLGEVPPEHRMYRMHASPGPKLEPPPPPPVLKEEC